MSKMVIVLIVLIILAVALIYMKREKFTELFYGGGGILQSLFDYVVDNPINFYQWVSILDYLKQFDEKDIGVRFKQYDNQQVEEKIEKHEQVNEQGKFEEKSFHLKQKLKIPEGKFTIKKLLEIAYEASQSKKSMEYFLDESIVSNMLESGEETKEKIEKQHYKLETLQTYLDNNDIKIIEEKLPINEIFEEIKNKMQEAKKND